jgi:hypothetical protein
MSRSFIYLFDQLDRRKEDASYVIKASYLEIYNEKEIFHLALATK